MKYLVFILILSFSFSALATGERDGSSTMVGNESCANPGVVDGQGSEATGGSGSSSGTTAPAAVEG